jgi:hypothetical protein
VEVTTNQQAHPANNSRDFTADNLRALGQFDKR